MTLGKTFGFSTSIFEDNQKRLQGYCKFFNIITQAHFVISYVQLYLFNASFNSEILPISFLVLFLNYYLLSKGFLFWAQVLLFSVVCLNLGWFTVLLGKDSGIFLLYIPTFAFFISMMNLQNQRNYIFVGTPFLLLTLFLVFKSVFSDSSPQIEQSSKFLYSSFVSSILITSLVLYLMTKAFYQSLNNSKKILDELNEKIIELSESKALLSKNVQNQNSLHNALLDFQKSLKTSKNNLKALIDNSTDFIWLLNEKFDIVVANRMFIEFSKAKFGIFYKEGSHFLDHKLPKELSKIFSDCFNETLKGSRFTKEMNYEDSVYEVAFNPVMEGKSIIGIALFGRDITESKLITKQLVNSENTLKSIVENINGGMGLFDLEFKTIYTNMFLDTAIFNEFGNRLRYGVPIFRFIPEKFHPIAHLLLEKAKMNEPYSMDVEVKPNRHYNVSIFPILDINEQVNGFTLLLMDISATKIAEKEALENKIKSEELVKSKENFLAVMSHELRTPMNAVIGMSHLLLQENPREDQVEYLKTLKFSADNLMVIINDVLDYSKLEAGKVTFERISFNLQEYVERLCKSFEPKVKEKRIDLKLDYDSKIPKTLIGDPYRLTQILNNLLSNAIKFTSEGSVTLSVFVSELKPNLVKTKFSVKDTGIGISKDKLETVFEAFSQAETSTTRKYGGTGLGLSITKKLIELFGSEIQVFSELGIGTEFVFDLEFDVAVLDTKKIEFDFDIDEQKLERKRVLLVEDNQINRMVATKFLKKFKMDVKVAEDGAEALEVFKNNDFDLILMDLQLPVMNGYEATAEIRKLNAKIPILAMTASILEQSRSHVLTSGFNDIVPKPFDPKHFKSMLFHYTNK
ncbi:MAG: response regulator [Cytophagales bacterium]